MRKKERLHKKKEEAMKEQSSPSLMFLLLFVFLLGYLVDLSSGQTATNSSYCYTIPATSNASAPSLSLLSVPLFFAPVSCISGVYPMSYNWTATSAASNNSFSVNIGFQPCSAFQNTFDEFVHKQFALSGNGQANGMVIPNYNDWYPEYMVLCNNVNVSCVFTDLQLCFSIEMLSVALSPSVSPILSPTRTNYPSSASFVSIEVAITSLFLLFLFSFLV